MASKAVFYIARNNIYKTKDKLYQRCCRYNRRNASFQHAKINDFWIKYVKVMTLTPPFLALFTADSYGHISKAPIVTLVGLCHNAAFILSMVDLWNLCSSDGASFFVRPSTTCTPSSQIVRCAVKVMLVRSPTTAAANARKWSPSLNLYGLLSLWGYQGWSSCGT